VKREIAPPRVYHAGHADQSTDPFWIAAELKDGLEAAANSRSSSKTSCSRTSGRNSEGSVKTTWKWRTDSARCMRAATSEPV